MKPRHPLTPDERTVALALGRVTFPPATKAKAIARTLHAEALVPDGKCTTVQSAALFSIAYRYRRQLPADVVAIAVRNGGSVDYVGASTGAPPLHR